MGVISCFSCGDQAAATSAKVADAQAREEKQRMQEERDAEERARAQTVLEKRAQQRELEEARGAAVRLLDVAQCACRGLPSREKKKKNKSKKSKKSNDHDDGDGDEDDDHDLRPVDQKLASHVMRHVNVTGKRHFEQLTAQLDAHATCWVAIGLRAAANCNPFS